MAETPAQAPTASKPADKVLVPVLIPNPLSNGIARTWSLLQALDLSPPNLVPSLFAALILLVVLAVLVLLWPYGWIMVMARFLWSLVSHAEEQLRQAPTYADKVPFTIALGIYFLIWLPLGALSLPLHLVGLIGELLAAVQSIEAEQPKAPERAGAPRHLERVALVSHVSGACLEGEEYRVEITSAEWMTDSELEVNRIRIKFLNSNKTPGILHAFIRGGSFFVDELGHQYDCITSEHIRHGRDILAGVAIQYALIFHAPRRPPGKISLLLVGSPGAQKGSSKWSFPTFDCDWKRK